MRKIITFAIENSGAEHTQTGRCPMSALGQKQTSAHVRVMSALPPKADMDQQADIEERDDVAPPRAEGSRIVLLHLTN